MNSSNQILSSLLGLFSALLVGALFCRQFEVAVFFGVSVGFCLVAEAFSIVSGGFRSGRDLM